MVYINKGEHDNPNELPKENSEGSLNIDNAVYTHTDVTTKLLEEIEKIRVHICHAHTSLGVTQSEMQHSTGDCFKLL